MILNIPSNMNGAIALIGAVVSPLGKPWIMSWNVHLTTLLY